MKEVLRNIKQAVWHRFGLYPIYALRKKISEQFPLRDLDLLEAFAYTGAWQARVYKDYARYHEAWEIQAICEEPLKRNLPGAIIKITNSFEEVKRCDKKFNFINVDTHQGLFGEYCEHFEFFPLMFRVMQDECMVVLNVIPNASQYWLDKYNGLFNAEQLRRRKEFYGCPDPSNISFDEMMKTYKRICEENGYRIEWHYFHQRTLTWYLALHLKKIKK